MNKEQYFKKLEEDRSTQLAPIKEQHEGHNAEFDGRDFICVDCSVHYVFSIFSRKFVEW